MRGLFAKRQTAILAASASLLTPAVKAAETGSSQTPPLPFQQMSSPSFSRKELLSYIPKDDYKLSLGNSNISLSPARRLLSVTMKSANASWLQGSSKSPSLISLSATKNFGSHDLGIQSISSYGSDSGITFHGATLQSRDLNLKLHYLSMSQGAATTSSFAAIMNSQIAKSLEEARGKQRLDFRADWEISPRLSLLAARSEINDVSTATTVNQYEELASLSVGSKSRVTLAQSGRHGAGKDTDLKRIAFSHRDESIAFNGFIETLSSDNANTGSLNADFQYRNSLSFVAAMKKSTEVSRSTGDSRFSLSLNPKPSIALNAFHSVVESDENSKQTNALQVQLSMPSKTSISGAYTEIQSSADDEKKLVLNVSTQPHDLAFIDFNFKEQEGTQKQEAVEFLAKTVKPISLALVDNAQMTFVQAFEEYGDFDSERRSFSASGNALSAKISIDYSMENRQQDDSQRKMIGATISDPNKSIGGNIKHGTRSNGNEETLPTNEVSVFLKPARLGGIFISYIMRPEDAQRNVQNVKALRSDYTAQLGHASLTAFHGIKTDFQSGKRSKEMGGNLHSSSWARS
ncbi:MAG: hypothetical protein GYA55_00315 [SAR324 cluster bacterium]|uniref:TIGR03016 family PEP-CTERM system-associated outer membrane protein n=1 Tax=SAR324 cluster bacterium TaxID=2024889 RepID=A0A7X9II18_9DELT|nr:hypothetical protein [SAR324 cluster bacterium]